MIVLRRTQAAVREQQQGPDGGGAESVFMGRGLLN